MKKYFIPIIGAISSGKTTFLKGFLGIDILETGSTTTTKFVCLIKNSDNFLFYHVLPKKEENIITFTKEGEVSEGEEQIIAKMKEINQSLSQIKKKDSLNNIFYMLEAPIKNINNEFILENSYFMDIPGLNENEKNYIDDIFSLISFNDILFEIIIFDSTNIGSDNIMNILLSLDKKKALKKENNLFILNKIDLCKKKDEIIENFKDYFYKTFEEGQNNIENGGKEEKEEIEGNIENEQDEENKENKESGVNNNKMQINIYKNKFIIMNSILYLSETKLKDDFNSLLLFELYNYLDKYKTKIHSFYEYIKKKLDFIISIEKIEINSEAKNIKGNLAKIAKGSIDYLKNIFKNNQLINLGLNKKSDKEFKNMYIIYKMKKYPIEFSDSYKQLQDFIKSINNEEDEPQDDQIEGEKELDKIEYEFNLENNDKQKVNLSLINKNNNLLIINVNLENVSHEFSRELSIEEFGKLNKFFKIFDDINNLIKSLNEIFKKKLLKIVENNGIIKLTIIPLESLAEINIKIPKKIPNNIDIIERLDKFLNEVFEEIDPEKEMKNFRIIFQTLRENILGRKIRISLIGNISVGKSTVLNCIIGENLLPTKEKECTYRGAILRYKDDDEFKLYKTKLISKGKGKDEYYFFEENKNPYCKGIDNIKDYLTNKNNDTNIDDEDAYILITGKLKIFDFLKLDENIIDKIEFIDLPGNDRENNEFNSKQYYKKILKFSNCCIYLNEPKSIEDQKSVSEMMTRYSSDKYKVFPNLRIHFIKTCIFLINKSDLIEDEKDRIKITQLLANNIKYMEKNVKDNEINISFFSGQSFEYFLKVQKNFIYLIENNPTKLFKILYDEWFQTLGLVDFKDFIINEFVSEVERKFDLENEEKVEEEEEKEEEEEVKIPEDFHKQLNNALNKIPIKIEKEDKNEIIQSLYNLYDNFKKKDFDKTIYSKEFFNKLNETIIFSDNLQEMNKQLSIADFLKYSDLLFSKKIDQENKEEIEILQSKFSQLQELFNNKKDMIKERINQGRENCIQILNDEIKKCDDKKIKNINESKNDLRKNLDGITDQIIEEERNVSTFLANEMYKITMQETNDFISSNEISKINVEDEDNKLMPGKMASGIAGVVGLGVGVPLSIFAESSLVGFFGGTVYTGTTAFVATSLASSLSFVGIGIGIPLLAYYGYNYFHQTERYKESLQSLKKSIHEYFYDYQSRFEENFKGQELEMIKLKEGMLEIKKIDLKKVDKNKWAKRKNEYLQLKTDIINAIEYNNSKI